MHECQREHDTACHKGYRADEHGHRGDLLPSIDHDGRVAEIEEVVAGEEELVDIVAEVVVTCQYLMNVAVAVSVADPAYSDRDDEGDEEVDYVSQNVHSSRLSKQISKNHYEKFTSQDLLCGVKGKDKVVAFHKLYGDLFFDFQELNSENVMAANLCFLRCCETKILRIFRMNTWIF